MHRTIGLTGYIGPLTLVRSSVSPDSLLRLWCYINHLLTHLLIYPDSQLVRCIIRVTGALRTLVLLVEQEIF